MSRQFAGALAAPLLLITACAGSADPDATVPLETGAAAVQALRAAPDVAAEAGTAAFEMVISGSDGGAPLGLVVTGVFDSGAQQMAMKMDFGAMLGETAEASGEDLPPGMDEPVRFVADGTTVYLRIPMLDALTGTSDWLSATPEDLGRAFAVFGLGASAYDPSTLLEVLRGATDALRSVGQEEVRGVLTTRYAATVRPAEALEQAPARPREHLQRQLDQLGAADAEIPVEVWVDADGLPRRVTMTFAGLAPQSGSGEDASIQISIELFDYGDPVTIEVPSADEVTPYADAFDALARAFSTAGA